MAIDPFTAMIATTITAEAYRAAKSVRCFNWRLFTRCSRMVPGRKRPGKAGNGDQMLRSVLRR